MKRLLAISLVAVLLLGAFGIRATPARAEPTTSIESIYFTAVELAELRLLRTQPSHSTIWSNISSWADAHVNDAPPTPPTSNDGYDWFGVNHKVRQYIETMGFMYAMTEDTAYADAAIDWMVSVSSWDKWGIPAKEFLDVAPLLRGFSFGYSVFHDYMSSSERQTILNVMARHTNDILAFLQQNLFTGEWLDDYPNHWGTLVPTVGLSALAIGGDHPDSSSWLNYATSATETLLSWGGEDGGWFEGEGYTMSMISYVIPFLDALKRAGTDLFDCDFLRNHAYYYIYLSYRINGRDSFMPMEDYESGVGYWVDYWKVNTLDFMYRLAKEYNNGYAQRFADLHCDQSVMQSYIWKSPTLAPLPIDGLPTTRFFNGIGYVVLKNGWGDNDLNIIFKSGSSQGHAQNSQNGFSIYNNGQKVTGSPGYLRGEEDDTWSHNCLLVNGVGQCEEPGNKTSSPLGTRGVVEQVDIATPYYRYMRGDASAVYILSGGELDK